MPDHTAVCVDLRRPVEPERLQHAGQRLRGAQVGGVELVVVAGIADGRGVEPGMARGELPVRVGDRRQRVATGAADHGGAQLVAEEPDGVQRQIAQQAVEPVDVRVERLAPDAEPGRQRGERERADALLVGEGGGGVDHRRVVEPHLRRHAGLRVRQSDDLSKIPGGISRAAPPVTPRTCRDGPRRLRTGRHRPAPPPTAARPCPGPSPR